MKRAKPYPLMVDTRVASPTRDNAAAHAGSRVVLFPEANLTSYFFPYLVKLDPAAVRGALQETCAAARRPAGSAPGSARAS